MTPLSRSSFSLINLSSKKIKFFRIFLGSLERLIVSYMAAPTKGVIFSSLGGGGLCHPIQEHLDQV